MRLSIGLASYGRVKCLSNLLDSFKKVDFDIDCELIFFENNKTENGKKCVEIVNRFEFPNKYIIHLEKNIGFFAGWNIIENIATGDWKLMLQDDMIFREKESFSKILEYAEKHQMEYLSLGGGGNPITPETNVHYSDWAHLENKSLRKRLGDYKAYPRHYNTLLDQSTSPEPTFGSLLSQNGIKFYKYHKQVCLPQFTDISLYQTLLHNVSSLGLPRGELEKIWENPDVDIMREICERYNITFFKQ